MKILFDHPTPFKFAHGGFQIQIEQTKRGLEACGVDVEWLRWWDTSQQGDVVHFFGRPTAWYVRSAQKKGMKVAISELLTGLGSRGKAGRNVQRFAIRLLRRSFFFDRMGWDTFRLADACIALTSWESSLMQTIFGAPEDRLHIVPNGVEEEFLSAPPLERGNWLVCTATVAERKRVLELARAAVKAKTPIWIIGKPYHESDSYARSFIAFAREHADIVRYEGAINDRATLAQIYRSSRGFVLLSTMESLSLSALEAAACGCPLLLSDLPWATTTFGESASYCKAGNEVESLRRFYAEATHLPIPKNPKGWSEIAAQLKLIYQNLLNGGAGHGV